MSQENDFIGIYTDLDTLLDTRMATLFRMDPSKIEGVLPMYFDRLSDEFPGYDTDAFKAAYAARDNATLKHAMLTEGIDILNYFAAKTLHARVGTPFKRQPKITVNTYPYTLSADVIDTIVKALVVHTENKSDIEVVNMTPSEVSPVFIQRTYALMAMYDYGPWLDLHTDNGNFSRTQLPSITLFVPALLRSLDAIPSFMTANVFDRITKLFSGMIKLNFLPVSKFSVNHLHYAEYLKKQKK